MVQSGKTVAQLEAELKQAKEREAGLVDAQIISRCNETLLNRYFLMKPSGSKTLTTQACRHYFKLNDVFGHGPFDLRSQVAYSSFCPRQSRAVYRHGLIIEHDYQRIETVHDLDRIHESICREITKAEFMQIVKAIGKFSEIGAELMMKFAGLSEPVEPVAENQAVLPDIPHIVLAPGETRFVSGWFLIANNVMLVSPESIRAVTEKIHEDDAADGRIAHLVEACDMQYLAGKAESKRSLQRKLQEAAKMLQP